MMIKRWTNTNTPNTKAYNIKPVFVNIPISDIHGVTNRLEQMEQ